MTRRLTVLAGLSAIAVVAPLLDLYGKNPEVFVANRTNTAEIVVFGLGVVIFVPLVSWGVLAVARLIGKRAPDRAFAALVGILALSAGFVVSRQIIPDHTLGAVGLAVGIGLFLFWLVRSIELVFVVAAVAIPVLLIMFLSTSATARLIWSEPEESVDSIEIASPHNLVMFQLDEMPLASIMDVDGTVNERLFPNFARLEEGGTWYRNALSDSIATTQSVPAILTGVRGEVGQSPSYVDHPNNLFTLVGDTYDMHVIEWVAELCPETTCPEYAGRSPARFSNLLRDVGVVYGHLTLPGAVRESLPSIHNSWKGFLGQEDAPVGTPVEIDGLPVPPDGEREDWVDWVQRLINGIDSGNGPTLSYAHLKAPHVPWVLNPSGTQYDRPEEYTEVDGVEGDGRWGLDPSPALLGFQRHLYQVGFLDVMLGRMLDHLEETGTWDDTMVIVVADHGASFVPGEHRRWPYDDNRSDLYRVPLFIKYPGQSTGRTVDLPAFGVDVLPTIAEILEVDTDWEFDGVSLVDLDVDRPHEPIRWCCSGDAASTDIDVLFDQVERNHEWVPDQSSWSGIAGVGASSHLIGSGVDDLSLGQGAFRWSLDLGADLEAVDLASGHVQTVLTGRIESDSSLVDGQLLIVLNDVVAGMAYMSRDSVDGASISGLVAERLVRDGENEVEILAPDGNGGWLWGSNEDLTLELVADDGHQITVGAEGNRRIQVDTVGFEEGSWELKGWAADVSAKVTPDMFYVFAGDELVYSGPPNADNANVVRWFESEDLLRSGFEISIPGDRVPEGVDRLLVVAEFGDQAVADPATLNR